MPLINCKIHLELNWTKDFVMSAIPATIFIITNTKLYVPIITLSSKDNVRLVKLLEEDLKDLFIGTSTKQKQKQEIQTITLTRFLFYASFKGVRRFFFFLAFNNTTVNVPNNPIDNTNNRVERNSRTKSSLPRLNITNYNVLINGRNFYDQSINDLIKHCDEIKITRRSR